MKRREKKKADFILSADWHLTTTTPECRTDDFIDAQRKKVEFIFNLAARENCPIIIAGDLGDKAQWANSLLEWFISQVQEFQVTIYCVPGQHDLPQHRLEAMKKSGIGVLFASKVISMNSPNIQFFGYGEQISSSSSSSKRIAVLHQMVIKEKELWPGQKAPKAISLLKKYPCYDLIVTGDNHQSFVEEYEGRNLVNPGSLMRIAANQDSHKPAVYLWYQSSNTVIPVFLPIEEGVVSRKHIEITQERDKRLESFVMKLRERYEISLDFRTSIKNYFQENRTRASVREKVWRAVEGG